MVSLDHTIEDGVVLAESVRKVATQARRILRRPANLPDVQALLSAIDRLEQVARSRGSVDLSRWLASLRRQVEGHPRVQT